MSKPYHLTVITTELSVQQVREAMSFFGGTEIHHKGWTVRGRQYVRCDAIVYRDIPSTEEAHAVLVDRLQEYTSLFTLRTWWTRFRTRCPNCLEFVENCVCDLLADQTLADPVDDEE